MRKAIITGCSSGIGKELAILLSENGYEVGLIARREQLLIDVSKKCKNQTYICPADVSKVDDFKEKMNDLFKKMGKVDLFIISHGIGHLNPLLRWRRTSEVIDVNVRGFALTANIAFRYFRRKKTGHLVTVSSTAALRGTAISPDYHASKAFVHNYTQSLRHQAFNLNLPIIVTEIMPGFVDTPMLRGVDGLFWVTPAKKAAKQIFNGIKKKKNFIYVSKRWRLIAWFLKFLPDCIYHRI